MKVYLISMMNAFVLMIFGLWGYLGSDTPSTSALIPVITGALLITFIKGLRYGSKPMAHFSAVLTFLILVALILPLIISIESANSNAIYRIGFMMFSCAVTLGFFIQSFVRVRKKRMRIKG